MTLTPLRYHQLLAKTFNWDEWIDLDKVIPNRVEHLSEKCGQMVEIIRLQRHLPN
ncbi:hypothetical protein [Nostoc sp. ChiQUE01b]|uniref:hypothetical protein n=1 Tax=Nostoc sp. ChiQUE01b TaxID=3075376 RepID=UPI002AD38162|nr:hypothetical protein [Nostoc sp. ChiQUE01b]MDZ8262641.1 hypothetical protein [Nostoc sp. ChiQUE01b]